MCIPYISLWCLVSGHVIKSWHFLWHWCIFVTSLHKIEHVLTAVIDTSARVALMIRRSMCFRCRFWPRPLRWSLWCWWAKSCRTRATSTGSTWRPSWSRWVSACSCCPAPRANTRPQSPPSPASSSSADTSSSTASPPTGRTTCSSTRCRRCRWCSVSISSHVSSRWALCWNRAPSSTRWPSWCGTLSLRCTPCCCQFAPPSVSSSSSTPSHSSARPSSPSSWLCGRPSPSSCLASSMVTPSPWWAAWA